MNFFNTAVGKTLIIIVALMITAAAVIWFVASRKPAAPVEHTPSMDSYVSRYHPAHIGSQQAFTIFQNENAVVLDIRENEPYSQSHVEGAVNVPPGTVEAYAAKNLPDKNRPIICYCYCGDNGGAAYTAYEQLTALGYTRVFYTEPGTDWAYQGTQVAQDGDDTTVSTIITGEQAMQMRTSDPAVILLDVRNQDEYDRGHIPGSILIPVNQLEQNLSKLPNRSAAIIIYCRSGQRSATACGILNSAGYTQIYDMQAAENWPEGLTV